MREGFLPVRKQIFLAIVFLALGLRLLGLGWGLPNEKRPVCYYPDDYTVIWLLSNMKPSQLDFNPRYFHNPTFFYYQVGAAIKASSLVGLLPKNQDKAYFQSHRDAYMKLYLIGRRLVVIYSIGCLFLIYKIGKNLFNPQVGLWAAFLWAVVPIAIYSSQCLEVSTPMVFWSGFYLLACIKATQLKSFRWLYAAAVLFGLTVSTKYLMGPFVFALFMAHRSTARSWISPHLLGLGGVSLFFFILGSPYILLDFHSFVEGFMFSFRASGLEETRQWNFGPKHLGYTMGWPLCVLSIYYFVKTLIKKEKLTLLVAVPLCLFVLLLSASSKEVSRYYLMPVFVLIPYAGWGLYKITHGSLKTGIKLALLIVILTPTYLLAMARTITTAYDPDPREISSEWIENHIPSGSEIGLIWEPLWYTPGVLFTDYRKQMGIETGTARYHSIIGNVNDDRPWDGHHPDYLVLEETEWRVNSKSDLKKNVVWPPSIEGYLPIQTFKKEPHLGPWVVKRRFYQSYEWFHPFPVITIYKRSPDV